jgi:ribosomal protein S18 acetylase RimI-like enzyme
MHLKIRAIAKGELLFLEEYFYQSLFVPEGDPPFPRSILDEAHLAKYIQYWGSRPEDICLLAEVEDEIVGACWGRRFNADEKGYGFVNEASPEIGIAISQEYRGQGIGTQLLNAIFEAYRTLGILQLSLSVDKRNRAVHLYKKLGFQIVKEAENAFTMLKELEAPE